MRPVTLLRILPLILLALCLQPRFGHAGEAGADAAADAAADAPAEAAAEQVDPDADAAPAEVVEEGATETEVIGERIALAERFEQGGLTMWFLLALSFVAVTFTIERLVRLRRATVVPDGLNSAVRLAWQNGDHQAILRHCQQQPSVLAGAIELMVEHRNLTASEISGMVGDEVSRLMRQHLGKAYPMAVVATLAPLLGLLGTVTGMIDSFEVVAIAGSLGDASLLAGGISKALVTTAFGLIVSIPSLGSYHFFRGRTANLALEVEEAANNLLAAWFHGGSVSATGADAGAPEAAVAPAPAPDAPADGAQS